MDWFRRNSACFGSVLFRGTLPPQPEELRGLASAGVQATAAPPRADTFWGLDLEHPLWGKAELVALRGMDPVEPLLIEHDRRLSPAEKDLARLGEAHLGLRLRGARDQILRDRKNLLRFLRAVMGGDGVVALDATAQAFWSREALDDELRHDADLDIEALFTLHAVTPDEGTRVAWLHSHGLGEIGYFDFDVLEPSDDVMGAASDVLRAIAFAIVEGALTPSGGAFEAMRPGGRFEAVPVAAFNARADARARALRDDGDGSHSRDRVVLCEPRGGVLTRWLRGVQPSRFLSRALTEQPLINFSVSASILMAQRARQTYSRLRELRDEFSDLPLPTLVKLGYEVDGGGENELEHLWFEVHELHDQEIDATLLNTPFDIAAMHAGQRGRHPIGRLTAWSILTPFGTIGPHQTSALRWLRERRHEVKAPPA
jgi:hypothetical protein